MARNANAEARVTFKVFNQDFNRAMSEMDAASRKARKEMQLAEEQLKANGTQTQKLEAKLKGLEQQQQIAAEKVRLASEQYERAKATFGENSVEAQRLEQQVLSLSIAEQRLANSVLSTSQDIAKHQKAMKDFDNVLALAEGSVDDFANALGDDLTDAIKNGTATARQLERAMTIIGQTALGTGNDVSHLREALRQIDQGVNLDTVRQDLSRLGQEAGEAERDVESLKDTLKGVGGTLAASIGIGTAVTQAMDVSSMNTKIAITFDVPPESVESVRAAAKTVEAYGLDSQMALEAVRRQWALNADATDEANTKIIKGAGMIAASYDGIDLIELVQETNEVAAALEITNEEALALTNALLKAGFPPEQLDTISEYGTQMKEAGFSAAEVQAIFEAGIDTKTWNIDNLNDGVKEARLQMATFGSEIPKALSPLLEQAGMSEEKFRSWGEAVAKGGQDGAVAMSEMVTWLDLMEEGTLKNDLASQIFKTKWEDQGQNMIAVFQGLGDVQDQTLQNQNELNTAIDQMDQDPTVQLRQAMIDIQTELAPVLVVIADVIGAIAAWGSENSTLAATITAIITVIGIIIATLTALAPIFTAVSTAAGVAGVSIGAIAAPVLAVVGVITGLIAIGVALYKNWDEITAKADALKQAIPAKFEELKTGAVTKMNEVKQQTIGKMTELKDGAVAKISEMKTAAVSRFIEIKDGVVGRVNDMKTGVTSKVDEIKSAVGRKFTETKDAILKPIEDAKTKVSRVVDDIKGFFTGMTLKLPEIKIPKLPRFTLTGEFSLNPPSVPRVGIQWNAKGAIFTKPTVFNSPNYGLQGFGEAGPEAAIPLNKSVLGTIGHMIAQTMPTTSSAAVVNIQPAPVILDGQKVAEVTFKPVGNMQYSAANVAALTRGVPLK